VEGGGCAKAAGLRAEKAGAEAPAFRIVDDENI